MKIPITSRIILMIGRMISIQTRKDDFSISSSTAVGICFVFSRDAKDSVIDFSLSSNKDEAVEKFHWRFSNCEGFYSNTSYIAFLDDKNLFNRIKINDRSEKKNPTQRLLPRQRDENVEDCQVISKISVGKKTRKCP